MSSGHVVSITDRDGWRKVFPLDSKIIYIGSGAGISVTLDPARGGGVVGRHLQLVAQRSGTYRAINLSDQGIPMGQAAEQGATQPMIPPHVAQEIADGDILRLGEFVLEFHFGSKASEGSPQMSDPFASLRRAPIVSPTVQAADLESRPAPAQRVPAAPDSRSRTVAHNSHEPSYDPTGVIGLQLVLNSNKLEPDLPLDGTIKVRNQGNEPGVQFHLSLEGLDPDCYEMGAGPILFPNVEKSVQLRLLHSSGPGLAAGLRQITIRASAPAAYPGASVAVSREIEILPYFHHSMRLQTIVE